MAYISRTLNEFALSLAVQSKLNLDSYKGKVFCLPMLGSQSPHEWDMYAMPRVGTDICPGSFNFHASPALGCGHCCTYILNCIRR